MTKCKTRRDWKLGKALSAMTAVYLLCSIFGCALHFVLPTYLNTIGSRFHAYLLFGAAMEEGKHIWLNVFMVLAHLYLLCQVVFGVAALQTGRLRPFVLLTLAEIVMTAVLLAANGYFNQEYAAGVLLNLAYCVWIFRRSLPKKASVTT